MIQKERTLHWGTRKERGKLIPREEKASGNTASARKTASLSIAWANKKEKSGPPFPLEKSICQWGGKTGARKTRGNQGGSPLFVEGTKTMRCPVGGRERSGGSLKEKKRGGASLLSGGWGYGRACSKTKEKDQSPSRDKPNPSTNKGGNNSGKGGGNEVLRLPPYKTVTLHS